MKCGLKIGFFLKYFGLHFGFVLCFEVATAWSGLLTAQVCIRGRPFNNDLWSNIAEIFVAAFFRFVCEEETKTKRNLMRQHSNRFGATAQIKFDAHRFQVRRLESIGNNEWEGVDEAEGFNTGSKLKSMAAAPIQMKQIERSTGNFRRRWAVMIGAEGGIGGIGGRVAAGSWRPRNVLVKALVVTWPFRANGGASISFLVLQPCLSSFVGAFVVFVCFFVCFFSFSSFASFSWFRRFFFVVVVVIFLSCAGDS